MVDFEKLNRERLANMTPEQRADHDFFLDKRTIAEAGLRPIPAKFTTFAWNGTENVPTKTWTADIDVSIRRRETSFGSIDRDTIVFDRASTGYERFHLTEDLRKEITDQKLGETWPICAGSDRYARCEVANADVAAFIALDDKRHASIASAVRETYEPERIPITIGWKPIEKSETAHARIERMRHAEGGSYVDEFVIRGEDRSWTVPMDDVRTKIAERAAAKDNEQIVPFDDRDAPALSAKAASAALSAADFHYAKALRAIVEATPREHAIALVGRTDHVTAGIRDFGTGLGRELTFERGALRGKVTLDTALLAELAKRSPADPVEFASARTPEGPTVQAVRTDHLISVLQAEKVMSRRVRSIEDPLLGRDLPSGEGARPVPSTDGMIDVRTRAGFDQAIAHLPGRHTDKDGRILIPVQVKRTDLDALLGRGTAAGAPIGDIAYGNALNFFADAVRQPVYKEFKPTGEERAGVAGVGLLMDGFGKGDHRKMWLDPTVMADIVVTPEARRGFRKFTSADGPQFLDALITGTAAREALVAAEKTLAKRRKAARPGQAPSTER